MKKRSSVIFYGFAGLTLFVFFWYHLYFSVNTPQEDEIRTVFQFILDWQKAPDFFSKIEVLISPENESRPVYFRLIVLIIFGLTGKINFTALMFIGILGLIPIYTMLGSQSVKSSPQILFICALLIFQPQYYFCSFRADASIFYLHGIGLACLAFYFLTKNRPTFNFYALFFAILAMLNSVAGLLVFAISIFYLVLFKKSKLSIFWGFLFVISLCFIFLNSDAGNTSSRFSDTISNKLLHSLTISLSFLGSFSQVENSFHPNVSILIGLIIAICFVIILSEFIRKWMLFLKLKFSNNTDASQTDFLVLFLLYLMATVVLIGLTRWIGDYENTLKGLTLERSKKIYPILILCCLVVYFSFKYLISSRLASGLMLLSITFNFYSYWFYTPEIAFIQRQISLDGYEFRQNKSLASLSVSPNNPVVVSVFSEILNRNYWNFPTTFFQKNEIILKSNTLVKATVEFKIQEIVRSNKDIDSKSKQFFIVQNDNLLNEKGDNFAEYYLLLQSQSSTFMLATMPNHNSKINFLKTFNLYRNGFVCEFQNVYPVGKYHLGLMSSASGRNQINWSNQYLNL